jgi:3-phenylpropionate/trans-cinnamate dioxygenase ferredoxin subunit
VPEFIHACVVNDIPDGGALRVVVGGLPLAVVRSDGEIYAIHDVCSHANVALSEGEVEGRTIECWLHGSRFDLVSGRPTGLPATKPVPVYPVRLDGNDIYIGVPQTDGRSMASSNPASPDPA